MLPRFRATPGRVHLFNLSPAPSSQKNVCHVAFKHRSLRANGDVRSKNASDAVMDPAMEGPQAGETTVRSRGLDIVKGSASKVARPPFLKDSRRGDSSISESVSLVSAALVDASFQDYTDMGTHKPRPTAALDRPGQNNINS